MTAYKEIITPVALLVLTLALSLIRIFVCSERYFASRIAPRLKFEDDRVAQALGVLYKRLSSFILFTLAVFLFVKYALGDSMKRYGLSKGSGNVSPAVILPLVAITVLTLVFYSRKERVYKNYPEVQLARVSKGYFIVSTVTYLLYFFGYESLYRGLLLFGIRRYAGDWTAIVISMVFTAFTHIRGSRHLLLGSVVLGFLFPYICLATESIRLVLVLHFLIGIGMDVLCIRTRARVGLSESTVLDGRASERQ